MFMPSKDMAFRIWNFRHFVTTEYQATFGGPLFAHRETLELFDSWDISWTII